jgi:hypothetical protein
VADLADMERVDSSSYKAPREKRHPPDVMPFCEILTFDTIPRSAGSRLSRLTQPSSR